MTKLSSLIQNPLFCSVPWIHTDIDVPNDIVRTCSKGKFEMGKFSDSVPVVWTNEKYNKLRQDFMNNIQSDNCISCAVGGDTRTVRGERNKSFYRRRFLNQSSEDIVQPKSVEVNLSNLSNVAPRYSYANESTVLNEFISRSETLSKHLVPTNSKIVTVDSLRGAFTDAEIVTIGGGEPFMFPGIVDLVDLILEESNSNLKQITFITSMNYKNQELLDKLDSLINKVSVVMNVYIDGPKDIYEYIRHGASFDTMCQNLKEMALNYRQFKFNPVFGISMLNVGYIPDLLETLHLIQKENKSITFVEAIFFVDNSKFLHPQNLPYSVKQEYLNKISNYDFTKNPISELRMILNMIRHMLTSAPKNSMSEFYEYIDAFDAVAGTDYKTLYPELAVGAPNGN